MTEPTIDIKELGPLVKEPKIIFLDIDGPMIPYRACFIEDQPLIMRLFDNCAVGMINHLCSEYGWKIVIHSSWVHIEGGESTLAHCIEQGIHGPHFHADAYVREDLYGRYTRVAEWLSRHPEVTKYVIIDDEPFSEDHDSKTIKFPEGMAGRLVKVNYYDGMLYRTLNKVRELDRD
jgi:hypothetical protein